MVKEHEIIDIPLGVGGDDGTDEKLVERGSASLSGTLNGYLKRTGELAKRNGLDAFDPTGMSVGARAIHAFGNSSDLAAIGTDGELYKYLEGLSTWSSVGDTKRCVLDTTNFTGRGAIQPSSYGIAEHGDYLGLFYHKNATTDFSNQTGRSEELEFVVLDKDTYVEVARISLDTNDSNSVTGAAVIFTMSAVNRIGLVYIYDPGAGAREIRYSYFDTSTATFKASPTTLTATLDSTRGMDAVIDEDTNSHFAVIYKDNTTTDVTFAYFGDGGSAVSSNTFVGTDVGGPVSISYNDFSSVFVLCWYYNNIIYTADCNAAGTSAWGPNTVEDLSVLYTTPFCYNIATLAQNTENTFIFYTVEDAAETVDVPFIKAATIITSSGSVGAPVVFKNDCNLISKPIVSGASSIYFIVSDGAGRTAQPSPSMLQIMKVNGNNGDMLGNFFIDRSIGAKTTLSFNLTNALYQQDGSFLAFLPRETNTESIADGILCGFDFRPTGYLNDVAVNGEIGSSLYLSTGAPYVFDKSALIEVGFDRYPKMVLATAAAGLLTVGDYGIALVYTWYDSQGNLHRSAPTIDTINVPGLPGNASILITYSVLHSTEKSDVTLEVYVTEVNDSIYYLYSVIAMDTTLREDTLTIVGVGNIQDTLLYTTGGEIESEPLPMCSYFGKDKDYAFLVPSEDEQTVYISKPLKQNITPEFSSSLSYSFLENEKGKVIAVKYFQGNRILFTEKEVYVVSGQGPDALGQGSFTFTPLDFGIGAINANVIATCSKGIFFQSKRGFELLDRGLNITYIGRRTEGVIDMSTVVSAFNDTIKSEVIVGAAARTLYWDYERDLWQNATGNGPTYIYDSTYREDILLQASSDIAAGPGKRETDYWDGILFSFTSPWIRLGSINGYQSVKRLEILGEFRATHNLTVIVYWDYDDTNFSTFVIPSSSVQTVVGGPYVAQIDLTKRKCTSMRVVLQTGFVATEGLTLTALSVEVNTKLGVRKKNTVLT